MREAGKRPARLFIQCEGHLVHAGRWKLWEHLSSGKRRLPAPRLVASSTTAEAANVGCFTGRDAEGEQKLVVPLR